MSYQVNGGSYGREYIQGWFPSIFQIKKIDKITRN